MCSFYFLCHNFLFADIEIASKPAIAINHSVAVNAINIPIIASFGIRTNEDVVRTITANISIKIRSHGLFSDISRLLETTRRAIPGMAKHNQRIAISIPRYLSPNIVLKIGDANQRAAARITL